MDTSGLARTESGLFIDLEAVDAELPDYRRLFLALRQGILARRIPGGTRLPSSRALAQSLGIARNTVKAAYELLQSEGYLDTRQGAGSFVAELPMAEVATALDPGTHTTRSREPGVPRPATRPALLQTGIPALDHFPYRRWQRALQQATLPTAMQSVDPAGDRRLRGEIARWLATQRGMTVDPEQVLITSGSQQGMYLIAQQLLEAGDRVLLERPGFPGTEQAMRAAGASITRFDQAQLGRAAHLPAARLALVTPSRNFPLGHTLAADKRLALLNWAYRQNAWLVEDDYDSEFAAGPALSALFSLDTQQRVLYAGTFSRTLFPGIRLGYLVLPQALVADFVAARRVMDGGLSNIPQLALAEFMASGDYSRHLRRMKRLYTERRASLEALLAQSRLHELDIIDAGGGMHLCLQLPPQSDDCAIVALLESEGVKVRALSRFDTGGARGLVLGFAAFEPDALDRGVRILERVVAPGSVPGGAE